jgi:hypothetical protein
VGRLRIWIAIALALSALIGTVLRAQLSDEEQRKRDAFLKARSQVSPGAHKTPTPTPKPKKKKTPARKKSSAAEESTPKPKAKAKPSETPEAEGKKENAERPTSNPPTQRSGAAGAQRRTEREESSTPKSKAKTKKKSTANKSPTPTGKRKRKKTSPAPEKTPQLEKTPAPPKAQAVQQPTPTPVERPTAPLPRAAPVPVPSREERAQVVVEKSGFEGDQGLAPTPSPPPRRGFLFWGSRSSGGGSSSYHYLTRSVIDEIRRAPVQRRRWQFIVVHNSGTRQGNARVFDYYHRHVRRMQNGLAYHFVIGNGTSTGNGQVEIGDRWRRQINGGHVHSDYLNNISLGICLVGDFNHDQPTRAQLECCEELIRYLRERCGKVDNHDIIVRPHREMNPPRWATDCPGNVFPYPWFRRFR